MIQELIKKLNLPLTEERKLQYIANMITENPRSLDFILDYKKSTITIKESKDHGKIIIQNIPITESKGESSNDRTAEA
jgi:hypothetical protein